MHRRGRPGPAGDLVQPDGQQSAESRSASSRSSAGAAAALRLGRLPRAAHPPDHRADGRRRPARRARAVRPAPRRARPSCCRPSSTGSRRCSPTCSRSAASTPAPTWCSSATTSTSVDVAAPGRRQRPGRLAEQRDGAGAGPGPRPSRASPRSTSAASSGSCATSSPTPSTTPRTATTPASWCVAGDEHSAAIARARPRASACAPGESAMVFNRFWRADPARARTSGGTGLGLSISLEDTHLHGGWLQAWGRPGEGVSVPADVATQAAVSVLRHSPLPLVPADVSRSPYRQAATGDLRSRSTGLRAARSCAAYSVRHRRVPGCPVKGPSPTVDNAGSTTTAPGCLLRPASHAAGGGVGAPRSSTNFLEAMKATPSRMNVDRQGVPHRRRASAALDTAAGARSPPTAEPPDDPVE